MLEKPEDILEYVKTKENDLNDDLHLMDIDYDIWSLKPDPSSTTSYLTDIENKTQKHDSELNVVSNDPRTFTDNVQARLSSADRQIMVRMPESEGEDKREDIGKLERLFAFAFEKADERLRRQLFAPLRDSIIWYSCTRGGAGARVLIYKDGNNVTFDIVPLDPRWMTPDPGVNGIVRNGYKTFRSKAAIASLYGEEETKFISKKKDNEVIDFWEEVNKDGKSEFWNSVVCGGKFLKEPEKHDVPSMPIILIPVGSVPRVSLVGGKIAGMYGQSLFASIRDINNLRNRYVSMVANHANLMASQALINYKTPQGRSIKTTSNVPGGVLELTKGENVLEASPMQEISPSVLVFLDWLNDRVENGMLPKIDINKPPSGTLYNLVESTSARVYNPQLALLSNIYADMCHLIEEQMIVGRLKVKIEGKEKDKYFQVDVKPVDLKKPHTINVEFTASTPWSQMDTYQVAQIAKGIGIPDSFIWEYILKVPDPKGMSDQNAIEMAEKSPKLAMVQAVKALMKAGRDEEAQGIMEDLYNMTLQETIDVQSGQLESTGEITTPERAI